MKWCILFYVRGCGLVTDLEIQAPSVYEAYVFAKLYRVRVLAWDDEINAIGIMGICDDNADVDVVYDLEGKEIML